MRRILTVAAVAFTPVAWCGPLWLADDYRGFDWSALGWLAVTLPACEWVWSIQRRRSE